MVTAKIWDTAGQERFRTITHAFYKQAEGVMLVFDLTSHASYDSIHSWVSSIHEHADENIVKYLVGNKLDMQANREVTKEEGMRMAEEYRMKYFETSAKGNVNVSETIEALIKDIRANASMRDDMIKLTSRASSKGKKAKTKAGCCTIF